MPRSFSSFAIASRRSTFRIFVPDIGHSVTNRTYRGTWNAATFPGSSSSRQMSPVWNQPSWSIANDVFSSSRK